MKLPPPSSLEQKQSQPTVAAAVMVAEKQRQMVHGQRGEEEVECEGGTSVFRSPFLFSPVASAYDLS